MVPSCCGSLTSPALAGETFMPFDPNPADPVLPNPAIVDGNAVVYVKVRKYIVGVWPKVLTLTSDQMAT